MKRAFGMVAVAALLAACGEQPQTSTERTNKQDATPYTSTSQAFVEGGWTPGDKASWEAHLKARGQYGQNDYSRMN